MSDKIDFILPWVDGNDPEWLKEKNKYDNKTSNDSREVRYRDWDNLQYWFRGVEQFAPWVNKIHFITWGHVPEWLNVNHPKLNIVKHTDYIPEKYLPTFSSHVIELNFHRIKELAEHFVYFNDDTFIIDNVNKEDFFKNNLPRDIAVIKPIINTFRESTGAIVSNNMEIINTKYNKNVVIKNNFSKWFSPSYKKHLISTMLMMPFHQFAGFLNPHLPNSYLKNTFTELWDEEKEILDKTCQNKFRDGRDVNQWLFRYKQLVEGQFIPRSADGGRTYNLTNDNSDVIRAIGNKKYKIVCINDNDKEVIENVDKVKNEIIDAFQTVLPNKSSYEK
ncbi:stealth family protein [Oceanobacillus oncorhynchi subsp. oncorhynchi]|uniref:Stealth CR1 domain-containing protein n=1 Tax=Oceanobacillus oncorhynchi TaxID=545501 RepID=UPI0031CE614C